MIKGILYFAGGVLVGYVGYQYYLSHKAQILTATNSVKSAVNTATTSTTTK